MCAKNPKKPDDIPRANGASASQRRSEGAAKPETYTIGRPRIESATRRGNVATMKRSSRILAAAVLVQCAACGGDRAHPGPGDDAGGGAADAGGPRDGATPSPDAGGGPGADAGSSACEPTGGSAMVAMNCDEMIVAVLAQSSGPTRVHVSGRLFGPTMDACARIDSVELVEGGRTVETITASRTVRTYATGVWAVADATTDISAPCSGDTGRFDTLGLRVRGTTDGGTFEALCGTLDSGSSWPPRVVRTCHSGIDAPPFGGNALVMPLGPSTSTDLYGAFPHPDGTMLLTAATDVRVIPLAYTGFGGGPPLMPRDTTGWMAFANEMGDGYGGSFSQVSVFNDADPLGTELCPAGVVMPGPDFMPPPVFLGRISGTTSRGAFTSEIYFRMCTRPPAGP